MVSRFSRWRLNDFPNPQRHRLLRPPSDLGADHPRQARGGARHAGGTAAGGSVCPRPGSLRRLAANDALALAAQIGLGSEVVDLCAGLGGPARYLAHRYGADVTGIELTPARVAGAAELSRRVGLDNQVRVLEGNVMDLPLPDAGYDAVVSQEALLHVPDIARAFTEAYRVLRPGGRIAF